jgi:hypothetical protein
MDRAQLELQYLRATARWMTEVHKTEALARQGSPEFSQQEQKESAAFAAYQAARLAFAICPLPKD